MAVGRREKRAMVELKDRTPGACSLAVRPACSDSRVSGGVVVVVQQGWMLQLVRGGEGNKRGREGKDGEIVDVKLFQAFLQAHVRVVVVVAVEAVSIPVNPRRTGRAKYVLNSN